MDALEVSPFAPTVFGAMSRRRGLVLVCVVLLGAVGIAIGVKTSGAATAKASILVEDPSASNPDAHYAANQASIMKMPKTADVAAAGVNKQFPSAHLTGRQLSKHLTVSLDQNSDLITVSYRDSSPEIAQAGANALVDAYKAVVTTIASDANKNEIDGLRKAIATVTAQINTDPAARAAGSPQQAVLSQLYSQWSAATGKSAVTLTGIVDSSPAAVPSSASKSAAIRFGLLGVVLGLLVGAALAYFTVNRRPRIENRLEPELLLERPFLAEIPDFTLDRLPSDLPAFDGERSAAAEGFRFAADALESGQTYAVISATSGDGKSVTVANLAVTAARSGKRVLAIDANFDGQGLSWLLGVPSERVGLADVLHGSISAEEGIRLVEQVPGKLFILPPGLADDGRPVTFDPEAIGDVLKEVRRRFDLVLIDAPAVLERAAGTALAKQADAAVAIIPFGADIRVTEEFAKRISLLSLPVRGYFFTRSPRRGGTGAGKRRAAQPAARKAGLSGGSSGQGGNRYNKPSVGSGV
ncbi:AAA family ATPase [Pseudofrankia sp. DC12]|uniref:tyrosine-protein kinase family protein n=1 Tax=Pseudofrankia sp. DC12 TaxID=683315 RepID=UPI0005F88A7F|nr:AAA family ATPase [Pseudofrankia sp. DC12]